VRPLNDQGVLGYCEKCGIVYVLKNRVEGAWDKEELGFGAGVTGESSGPNTLRGVSVAEATTPPQSRGSYWRCPDCDTEIHSDDDSDLGFARREHIREYHPNRSTG
jgi:hypothetical protein